MNYRIAVVDIGTYSTRLLISAVHIKPTLEETLNSIEDVFSVGRITALGRKLKETGYLQEEAINEVLSTLKEYVLIAKEYGVEEIIGYATQACREAKNGTELLEKVKQLGIDVKLITGEEEAYLSFLATAYGVKPEKDFVVIDQGGGSTEFVYGEKNSKYSLKASVSFPFGIVSLTERFIKSDPPKKEELEHMREFIVEKLSKIKDFGKAHQFIGLGGTITTLVALENHIFPYVSSKVHGKVLKRDSIKKWLEKLSSMRIEDRKAIPVIEDKRAEVIISGIVIFDTALDFFGKDSITVSDWGLRHGAVIKRVMERFND
ncbi:exopolyphosphatase / guanosine-5'-triphosphate,3'-diphosphate pyrophosphatase [Persephonella hydrogeniphila]|uniref:Exopolyphosphatase / guanosine-5'-triphosphate,3'-diphosphate pyrophosphatase n=1 Tax=Persephonella hydrogeniphila TaxID=198703 RepID=A0A285NNN0_9AQUI|nr:Ppx/GppA phosphatase family protein [Persephonella hydrogeniphila]SNZ09466.1 exopolyphosphatase / guanosine-5'-triphosphate,3'-diphosphate pyrophosphatase [Persephonella hydrogeniphila]